jgi:hypothetical protein
VPPMYKLNLASFSLKGHKYSLNVKDFFFQFPKVKFHFFLMDLLNSLLKYPQEPI